MTPPSHMKLILLFAVALASSFFSVSASLYHITPRSYYYSRRPSCSQDAWNDVLNDVVRIPSFLNSILKQQQQQLQEQEQARASRWTPRYTFFKQAKHLRLDIEVPGVAIQDLVVQLEGETCIRIKGTRKARGDGSMLDESQFDLAFPLTEDLVCDSITVSLSAGLLSVNIPRKENIVKTLDITTDKEDHGVIEPIDVVD